MIGSVEMANGKMMKAMSKTALTILAFLGAVALYFLALIIATIIAIHIFVTNDSDDFDYVMVANVIQFCVMMEIIAEKVWQWMT